MLKECLSCAVGNETITVLRSLREYPVYEETPGGPFHDFWLLPTDDYDHSDFLSLAGRRDAPVRLPDEQLAPFWLTLSWLPTISPGSRSNVAMHGLHQCGITIINAQGANLWAEMLRGWAKILTTGPSVLRLHSGFIYNPYEKVDSEKAGKYRYILLVERDPFVANLNLLAQWGGTAATATHFILHLGI